LGQTKDKEQIPLVSGLVSVYLFGMANRAVRGCDDENYKREVMRTKFDFMAVLI
jgi:hypothetical protein